MAIGRKRREEGTPHRSQSNVNVNDGKTRTQGGGGTQGAGHNNGDSAGGKERGHTLGKLEWQRDATTPSLPAAFTRGGEGSQEPGWARRGWLDQEV